MDLHNSIQRIVELKGEKIYEALNELDDDVEYTFIRYVGSIFVNEEYCKHIMKNINFSIDDLLIRLEEVEIESPIIVVADRLISLFPGTIDFEPIINLLKNDTYKNYLKMKNPKIAPKPDYVSLLIHEGKDLLEDNIFDTFEEHEEIISRIWGPKNKIKELDCIGKEGKDCRMFYCLCRETDEYDIEATDWFTGKCLQCFSIISNISFAVRLPLENGGFKGCYCCLECIENGNLLNEKERENLQKLKDSLEKFGVMDRNNF
jgi:hypothetical protein